MKRFRLATLVTVALGSSAILAPGCLAPYQGGWKIIESQKPYDQAWQAITTTLSDKYDLDVVQKDSGYLRTAWKQQSESYGLATYRSRASLQVESKEPLKFRVKVEVEKNVSGTWQTADASHGDAKEREILEELRGRLATPGA